MFKSNGDKPKEVKQTKRPISTSKKFIEAAATPGMSGTSALMVVNAHEGNPKHGFPGNHDHIIAYKKSKALRSHIEERKQLALQFTNVTPEMVLGATAMRAFASID